jgi:hypothetical protein
MHLRTAAGRGTRRGATEKAACPVAWNVMTGWA